MFFFSLSPLKIIFICSFIFLIMRDNQNPPFPPRVNEKVFGCKQVCIFEIFMEISDQIYTLYKYMAFRYQLQYITSNGKDECGKPYILNQIIFWRRSHVKKNSSQILSYWLCHLNLIFILPQILEHSFPGHLQRRFSSEGDRFCPWNICWVFGAHLHFARPVTAGRNAMDHGIGEVKKSSYSLRLRMTGIQTNTGGHLETRGHFKSHLGERTILSHEETASA